MWNFDFTKIDPPSAIVTILHVNENLKKLKTGFVDLALKNDFNLSKLPNLFYTTNTMLMQYKQQMHLLSLFE